MRIQAGKALGRDTYLFGNVVLFVDQIAKIDVAVTLREKREDAVRIYTTNGSYETWSGEDAEAIRRFLCIEVEAPR